MKTTSIAASSHSTLTNRRSSVPSNNNNQTVLYGLMVPFVMVILNLVLFNIALPAIRDNFNVQADTVAWLITAYMVPFMISMPLYGRLGDELDKQQLFLFGIVTFLLGTFVSTLSGSFSQLLVGRAIQGLGAASVVPLSMATISQIFPSTEQGKALGTWSSVGPMTGILAPSLGGLLIDYISWRTVFGPVLLVGFIAVWIVRSYLPDQQTSSRSGVLRTFDWGGVALLGLTMTLLTFYLSSPTITGVVVLQDWRLLSLTLIFFGTFILWERRQAKPYVFLSIFKDSVFSRAAFSAGVRMFVMSGVGFLLPLYLTDIYQLSATFISFIVMAHAGALFTTMRIGGQLADRWNSRRPVTIGMITQCLVMVGFALLPADAPLWFVGGGMIMHGLGAGLSLAALHRASMGRVPEAQVGMAAGVYSLVRFMGMGLGPILAGVALQQGLNQGLLMIEAYHIVFWMIAGVTVSGIVSGIGLRA